MTTTQTNPFTRARLAAAPIVAVDRDPEDPCQAGTVGCCIDHRNDEGCETW